MVESTAKAQVIEEKVVEGSQMVTDKAEVAAVEEALSDVKLGEETGIEQPLIETLKVEATPTESITEVIATVGEPDVAPSVEIAQSEAPSTPDIVEQHPIDAPDTSCGSVIFRDEDVTSSIPKLTEVVVTVMGDEAPNTELNEVVGDPDVVLQSSVAAPIQEQPVVASVVEVPPIMVTQSIMLVSEGVNDKAAKPV
jgi:hypothetical protein